MEELLERFGVDLSTGLTEDAAKKRYDIDVPNQLTPPPSVPEWRKFIKEMTGFFSILLRFLFASLICVIFSRFCVIFLSVLLASLVFAVL